MRTPLALLCAAVLAGCGVTAPSRQEAASVAAAPAAVVASRLEPAAQFQGSQVRYADGAVIGATGGAGTPSTARASISLQPPPAGSRPTPASTSPM